MDRAEAIEILSQTDVFDEEAQEAFDMAIAALREQEQSKAVQPFNEGATHNREQWISVKERLPETHQNVLVFQTDGRVLKGWLGTANKWFAPGVVSHWMPLPSAPKEENNG